MTTDPATAASRPRPEGLPGACTLDALHARIRVRHRNGGGSRPEVATVDVSGLLVGRDTVVLKDHNRCDRWFATLLGPLLAAREARALERLAGVRGVPALLGRLGSRALVLEHVAGRTLRRVGEEAGTDWSLLFSRLDDVVAQMHRRGVAHCDLRSASNVLVDDAGQPWLVDFVASVRDGGRFNPARRWMFRQFRDADLTALIKLKLRFSPGLVSEEDQRRLRGEGALAWCARRTGETVRVVARALFTRTG